MNHTQHKPFYQLIEIHPLHHGLYFHPLLLGYLSKVTYKKVRSHSEKVKALENVFIKMLKASGYITIKHN